MNALDTTKLLKHEIMMTFYNYTVTTHIIMLLNVN